MEKRNKIIYWVATSLLAIGMLQSGIFALVKSKEWIDLVTGLGYPEYFLIILGTWKILGVIAILIPKFPLIKEWAYAGFFFAMTGAFVSHIAVGDIAFISLAGSGFQTLFIILSWHFRPTDRKIMSNNK